MLLLIDLRFEVPSPSGQRCSSLLKELYLIPGRNYHRHCHKQGAEKNIYTLEEGSKRRLEKIA
jgi:hypothetical protein